MTLTLPLAELAGFLLALVRAGAWIVVAPPFNTRAVPVQAKLGLAGALALAATPSVAAQAPSLETGPLIVAAATQAAAGVLLGFVALLLFAAVQAAGQLVDLFGGFTVAPAFDPLSNGQSSVFGRVYQLLAVTLLFATDGHVLLVRGFLQSFEAVPLAGVGANDVARLLVSDFGVFFVAALEIAAPLLAVLFLAEVALGLLSRAAPQLNVFVLGFPFKILLTLLLVGFALPLLPDAVGSLVNQAVRTGASVARAIPTP